MRTIKSAILLCLGFLLSGGAHQLAFGADVDARPVVFQTTHLPVTAQLFAAQGEGKRPAVVILHGVQGLGQFLAFYQRYAAAIARSGIDAYLLPYYDESDLVQTKSKIAEERHAVFSKRVRPWSVLVSDVVGDIVSERRSSGQVGLLGFSQGGFLATAVAAQDKRISTLVVFYGGIPSAFQNEITHLPSLLEFHGDADRVVPIADGRALVDLGRRLGQSSEMVVYPGAGHGFDGADTIDAERRTTAFFQRRLLSDSTDKSEQ